MGEGTISTQVFANAEEGETFGAPSHIIKRPRLTKILDETEARIILLCAPAGYGKTTLAREWIATRSEPVLWYAGGPAMADVAALAVDLAELFGGPNSELANRLRATVAREQDPRRVGSALSEAIPHGATVVLDDIHFASSESSDLLRRVVLDSQVRALITSRQRPTWIENRRVIYREVLALNATDLAFTAAEADALLPANDEVRQQAQGWPALLGLAAAGDLTDGSFQGRSQAELYEYIASEIFDRVDEALRATLYKLAAGADSSREIAREALSEDQHRLLATVVDQGFAERDSEGWLSMHPLLRSFALHRLLDDPELARSIAGGVVATLRKYRRWDSCLAILDAIPIAGSVAEVLDEALYDLLRSGRTSAVRRWVELADRQHVTDPILLLATAEIALREGRDIDAFALSTEAARHLNGGRAANAHLAAARAAYQLDHAEATFENANAAEKLAEDYATRTDALCLAFSEAYAHYPDRVDESVARLESVSDPRPDYSVRVDAARTFAIIANGGSAIESLRIAQRGAAVARELPEPLSRSNILHLLAHLLWVTADYERTLEAADELVDYATQVGLDFVIPHALFAKAGALIGLRELRRASDVLRQIDASGTPYMRDNVKLLKARARIAAGDLDGARLALPDPVPTQTVGLESEYIALQALVDAARGDLGGARERQARLTSTAKRYTWVGATAELASAVEAFRVGQNVGTATSALANALRLGVRDIAVTACRAYPPLAKAAVEGGVGPDLEALFSTSRDASLGRQAGLSMPREHRRTPGLSPREREVLELIVQGRTNAEIANTLFISASTAKVHIKHIFEKLGVHSRAEAAAVGLGMLD